MSTPQRRRRPNCLERSPHGTRAMLSSAATWMSIDVECEPQVRPADIADVTDVSVSVSDRDSRALASIARAQTDDLPFDPARIGLPALTKEGHDSAPAWRDED